MPGRKIIYRAAGVMAALVAGALPVALTAANAGAATGPSIATKEQAGYQLSNAQFRFARATVFLRNPAQFAPSVGGLGQSVQFWGGGRVYVLGVSDTTSTSPWSPNVAVFNATTHTLICAASLANCTDQSGGFGSTSYATGHTVTEQVNYNLTSGALKFTMKDLTAATSASYTVNIGAGVSFRMVRVGTEFGNDPWTAPAFTAPAARQKLAAFSNVATFNYRGRLLPLTGSYAVTSELIMTGAGSVTEADAGPASPSGFATFLEP